MTEYLDLADLLVIGEQVLSVRAEVLAAGPRIQLAESALASPSASWAGIEAYPDLAVKAAVLCSHIAKNHGLPDGNKRVAFLCMVEFLARNGHDWMPPDGDWDGEVTDKVIRDVAAAELTDETVATLAEWIRGCAGIPGP